MRYLVKKNKKYRLFFNKNEKYLNILKSLINNKNFNNSLRLLLLRKFNTFSTFSYKTSITNRCFITGRKNIILKKYRLSRLQLPEIANNLFITGYSRTGW